MGGAALNINHQETITINRQTNVQFGNQARYPRYLPPIIQQQYNPIIGATQQDGNTIFYRCTFEAFPGQYYLQETYECINCWGLGSAFRVCLICANNCHKGHQLIPCQSQNQTKVICDCGRLQHQTELCTSQMCINVLIASIKKLIFKVEIMQAYVFLVQKNVTKAIELFIQVFQINFDVAAVYNNVEKNVKLNVIDLFSQYLQLIYKKILFLIHLKMFLRNRIIFILSNYQMGSSNTSNNPQRIVIVQTSVQKCFAQEKVHEITRKNPKSCPKQVKVFQNDQQQLESNNFSIKKASWIWPQGQLPFVIHSSVTQNMKNKLKQAMMEFSQTPIILFEIYSESSYPEFVKFYKSNKNTSYTNWCGRKANRGAHSVHLLETQSKGTYIHEIMHVLGFEHEQCRKDRDDYVTVHSENLQTQNQKHQYEIKPKGYMIGKYDANSIMHYPPTSEMTAKVQNNQMGQRECLSKGDIKGINFVYGDFQCTYDAFPEEYYAQPYYECVDCWDKDTCYGVCELCAVLCHDGHQLIFHPVEKGSNFVCDCGRYEHQTGLCTRKSTNKKYVKQHMYLCYDCFDYSNLKQNDNLLGVCLSCVRKCHKGHSVKYYALSNGFFCDCGLAKCKKACKAQKK